jgi:hypothetical protein
MLFTLMPLLTASGLVFFMLLGMVTGHRLGLRHLARGVKAEGTSLGVIESALFALFGLLIAFSFSGASNRYDARRMLIADEVNAIGTAYLRIDLLPAESQPAVRTLFRRYVEARLAVYHTLTDIDTAKNELAKAAGLQQEIWAAAATAARAKDSPASTALLVLPALNNMIDITTTRAMASLAHPPLIIFLLLLGAGILCSLLAGYEMAGATNRKQLHMLIFILVSGLTIYSILELEYPRLGLIRLDRFDEALLTLLESMK